MKNISAKMVEVMKECSHVLKNGQNSYHGYKYATSADVLDKVNASLTKHGISSTAMPEVVSMEKVTTAKGYEENRVVVKITIMLTDSESGESMTIVGLGGGQDSGDKAVMKAQTAAIKYAYMLSFAISTGDDPEDESVPPGVNPQTGEVQPRNRAPARQAPAPNYPPSGRPLGGGDNHCTNCGVWISDKVKEFSENRYGRALCMDCQQQIKGSA